MFKPIFVVVFLVSGVSCFYAFGGNKYRRVPTSLRSTSPFSDSTSPIRIIIVVTIIIRRRMIIIIIKVIIKVRII